MMKITGDIAEITGDLELYEFVVFQAYGEAPDMNAIPVYKYQQDAADVTETTSEQTYTLSV